MAVALEVPLVLMIDCLVRAPVVGFTFCTLIAFATCHTGHLHALQQDYSPRFLSQLVMCIDGGLSCASMDGEVRTRIYGGVGAA